ncbi:hypothetical protein N7454_002269 [Penicillium verhagenii]|nr:hypothetical protein N7454_002269 [Penicillium verhagenii]
MSKAISRKSYTDDLIYTCFIFQQIQIHYCPSSLAEWLTHFDGLGAIMKCYRPTKSTSQILATIYGQSHALSVVLAAFMHLPAEAIESFKKPKGDGILETLVSYTAEVSRIAAAIDTTDASDHEACHSLLNDALNIEMGARELDIRINHGVPGDPPVYARGELKTRVCQTDDLFGPAYRFSSLEDATLRILVWLLLSFTHPLICYCQSMVKAQTASRGQVRERSLEERANKLAEFYVSKSIRCLPYIGQVDMSPSGLHHGLLVAIQASRVYSHSRDQARFLWTQDLFSTLQLAGFDYVARFRDIFGAYWSDTDRHNVFRILNYRETVEKNKTPIQDHD